MIETLNTVALWIGWIVLGGGTLFLSVVAFVFIYAWLSGYRGPQ